MNKYIDPDYYCYNSISECLKHEHGNKYKLKNMLHRNPHLLIVNKESGEIIKEISNVQPLYLYPLSVLDYCKSLLLKDKVFLKMIKKINIIDFDANIDYIDKLNKLNLKKLSNIEIEINEKYNYNELISIINFINYLSINNKKITLLFKTLNIPDELLKKFSSTCDFFKIMMPNIINTSLFNDYKNKLKIISSNRKDTSVVLIKSYLSIEQNNYYEEAIIIFDELNIDIFQLSKELIPIGQNNNPLIAQNIQDNIRKLEKKYSSTSRTRFISVKEISTLYYPRFELDERNSRKCYACVMKPYIYKDKIIPCRVNKVITNINDWYLSSLDNNVEENHISNCGTNCDDCASIFENDLLNEIDKTIKNHKGESIEFILEAEE